MDDAKPPLILSYKQMQSRKRKLRAIFITLALLSVIINLDGGAVPGSLVHIENTYQLNVTEVGLIGSLVYFGIAIGCVLVGPLLRKVSPIRATQATLMLNTGATLAFGLAQSKPMLLGFRFLIGFLQAIPAVYFPVWVDEFAPTDACTIWMAVIQAGAPIGIMLGYVFAGVVTLQTVGRCPAESLTCEWRYPFMMQSATLVLFTIGFLCIPKSLYDLGQPMPELDPSDAEAMAAAAEDREGDAASAQTYAAAVESTATRPSSASNASNASIGRVSMRRSAALRASFVDHMAEALMPMGARRPLIVGGATTMSPTTMSLADAERSQRMQDRMRRMSATPSGNAHSSADDSERHDDSARESTETPASPALHPTGAADALSPDTRRITIDVPSDPPGGSTPMRASGGLAGGGGGLGSPSGGADSHGMRQRRSMRRSARLSYHNDHRGPRLTLDSGVRDGSRHSRVVSIVDLFAGDRASARGRADSYGGSRGRSDSASSHVSRTTLPYKPSLTSIKSSGCVFAGVDMAEGGKAGTNAAAAAAGGGGVAAMGDNDSDGGAGDAPSPLRALLTNPVYMCTVFSLTALFFVVTGIQFWVTKYIIDVVGMPQEAVTGAFAVTSISAPLIGVFAGGTFIDKIGGYKGAAGLATTLKWCTIFAGCAAACAVTCAYVPLGIARAGGPDASMNAFIACIGLIAATLVFGGAVIPAATGCIVSVVHPDLRQVSSAGSMFCFQLLGYALSPLVSAGVASSVRLDCPSALDGSVAVPRPQVAPMSAEDASAVCAAYASVAASVPDGVWANTTVSVPGGALSFDGLLLHSHLARAQKNAEITTSFEVVMLWGCLGVLFMFFAWRNAKKAVLYDDDADGSAEGEPRKASAAATANSSSQQQPMACVSQQSSATPACVWSESAVSSRAPATSVCSSPGAASMSTVCGTSVCCTSAVRTSASDDDDDEAAVPDSPDAGLNRSPTLTKHVKNSADV